MPSLIHREKLKRPNRRSERRKLKRAITRDVSLPRISCFPRVGTLTVIVANLTVYSAEVMEEEQRRKEERKLAKLNGKASGSEDEHDDGMDSDDSFM